MTFHGRLFQSLIDLNVNAVKSHCMSTEFYYLKNAYADRGCYRLRQLIFLLIIFCQPLHPCSSHAMKHFYTRISFTLLTNTYISPRATDSKRLAFLVLNFKLTVDRKRADHFGIQVKAVRWFFFFSSSSLKPVQHFQVHALAIIILITL